MKAQEFLRKFRVNYVYHFTDRSNVGSIMKHGLLSLRQLAKLNIQSIRYASSDESRSIDRHYGLDDYVRLAFVDQHPMEYCAKINGSIEKPVYLQVDASVLSLDGVKVADGIAYAQGAVIKDIEDALDELDLEVLFTRMDWKIPAVMDRLKKARKYEVLVPSRIPARLIQRQ